MFSLRDVYLARRRIARFIRRTPLIYSKRFSKILGCDVYLKLENMQVTRAFKVRGGVNYVLSKEDEARRHGLITASTGNHAQSIAYAGSLVGARVVIVMPHNVPEIKVNAVKELGAEIVFHGDIFDEALDYAMELSRKQGLLFVHSVNEPLLYPGVGTMHLEVVEDLPDVDIVINPIGGGSGASSAVVVYKTIDPGISVIGVQAEGAPSMYMSLMEKKPVSTGYAKTIAEGLAVSRTYEYPFNILRDRINDVVLVNDNEILRAVKLLVELEGQVTEPAGAASVAAAFKLKDRLQNKNVVLMITGGNIDPSLLRNLMSNATRDMSM
ncbi:MAG: threonine/serine dehydratase [Desulfurococcaceae archaeon]